ncbi:MAG: hypothetical protein Q7S46_04405 [Gallionella sp.]|nr:hypothetical protein [Gallionella sp.]
MKPLNQPTKIERFPSDFMFQLSAEEKAEVVTNCDHLGKLKYSRVLLYALYHSPARSADKNLSSAFCHLMKQLAIRLGWQTTPAKSLVMSSERGISLIELIMFIVIVSVASAGIMLVMNNIAMYSADPLVRKQALTVAESLLEEIELQVFTPGGFAGPFDQPNRHRFDDIMDYNGFATTEVYPASGAVPVSGLQNYNVTVAVSAVNWGNIPSASAVQITVAVTDPMGQAVSAIGYRVAY